MQAQSLARVIEILETDPDFFVPVKRLWLTLQEEGLETDIPLHQFRKELSTDTRFEMTEPIDLQKELGNDPELADVISEEMESLGLYSGQQVKLVSREMSAVDVFNALGRSLKQMNQALKSAWDSRPEGDQSLEAQMMQILDAGEQLEHEIQELIETQLPESD